MHAQIVLRKIAPATTNFVNLLMRLRITGYAGNALYSRSNPAAIRFRPDRFHLDPIVPALRIAAHQLWIIIDRVDHHVEVAVIVEVSESAAPSRNRHRDTG